MAVVKTSIETKGNVCFLAKDMRAAYRWELPISPWVWQPAFESYAPLTLSTVTRTMISLLLGCWVNQGKLSGPKPDTNVDEPDLNSTQTPHRQPNPL